MSLRIERGMRWCIHFLVIACLFFSFYMGQRQNIQADSNTIIRLDKELQSSVLTDGIIYYGVLPESEEKGNIIGFYTSHVEVKVLVDDTIIYERKVEEGLFHTTGYVFNEINIDKYAGCTILIQIQSVYGDSVPEKCHEIYWGHQSDITTAVITQKLIHFLITIAILLVGIVLSGYALVFKKEFKDDNVVKNFAVFTVLLGIYYLTDSQVITLLVNCPIPLVAITHLVLMIMPTLFVKFIRYSYLDSGHVGWRFYINFNNSIVILRIALQIMGFMDFKETLWITHVSLIVLSLICTYLSILEIKGGNLTKDMRNILLGIVIVMVATIMDMFIYISSGENGANGAVGFFIYSILMGIHSMNQSKKIYERAKETEIYRRLAYTDELTGLFNRTAFQKDIASQEKNGVAIVMLDLNDLKKCNDIYGHEYGDRYLTMASGAISDIFSKEGRCYRIGGDEFCIIIKNADEKKLEKMISIFNRKIKQLNKQEFVVKVSVALGYCFFSQESDENLEDTRNRADKLMYEKKKQIKQDGSYNLKE